MRNESLPDWLEAKEAERANLTKQIVDLAFNKLVSGRFGTTQGWLFCAPTPRGEFELLKAMAEAGDTLQEVSQRYVNPNITVRFKWHPGKDYPRFMPEKTTIQIILESRRGKRSARQVVAELKCKGNQAQTITERVPTKWAFQFDKVVRGPRSALLKELGVFKKALELS